MKGKWSAPEPESELRSFENLSPEQEPEQLKFSRRHQPWSKHTVLMMSEVQVL